MEFFGAAWARSRHNPLSKGVAPLCNVEPCYMQGKLAAMNSFQQSISFHFLSSMNMKIFSRVYLSLIGYLLLDQQPGHVGLNEMRGSAISQLELSTSFRIRNMFTIIEYSLELLYLRIFTLC